jgi:hypothetical protein
VGRIHQRHLVFLRPLEEFRLLSLEVVRVLHVVNQGV